MIKCVISREAVEKGAVNDALRSGAVNWRPDAVSEFESLWSIVHKFAHLNRAGAVDVRIILGRAKWAKKLERGAFYWNEGQVDLHYLGCLDPNRLAQRLGLSQRQVEWSEAAAYALPAFESDNKLLVATWPHLSYCPECIQKGFHSSLYQLRWIVRCPIHDGSLVNRCPGCGEFIPYQLFPKALVNPYGCKCGRVLWQARDAMHWPRPLDATEEGVLAEYARWSAEVHHQPALAFREFGFSANSRAASEDGRTRYLDLMATGGRWNEICPVGGWHGHTFYRKQQEVRSHIEGGERFLRIRCQAATTEKTGSGITRKQLDALAADFRVVYKSIRRRLLRTVLRSHRQCIAKLSPLMLLEGFWLTPPFCPWAHAFMLWWAQWEGREARTVGILKRSPTLSLVHPSLMVQMEDCLHEAMTIVQVDERGRKGSQERIAMVRWICRRVLALSLLASFDHAVHYSIERSRVRWRGSKEHNVFHPYFLFQSDPGTGKYGIHWWMIPVLDRLEDQARATTWHTRKMERHIRSLTAKYYGWRKPRIRR